MGKGRKSMNGTSDFRFSRKLREKSPVSLVTVVVSAVLLVTLIHNGRALAGGCPVPSFAEPGLSSPGGVSLAVGDFDGDGRLDLAAANDYSSSLSILLGSGDGTFQNTTNYHVGFPACVAVGDFNGDGRLDLVVVNGAFGGTVLTFLGNGDGTFQPGVSYGVGVYPLCVAVSDFNGDGKRDLVVANGGSGPDFSDSSISVLLGNGGGTFLPAVNYRAGAHCQFVAVADFNGDTKPDLIVANSASANVSLLFGNGDGTFQPAVSYSAGAAPQSLAVADFNGDGKFDLAVANFGSRPDYTNAGISVLLGNGNGSFQPPVLYALGAFAYSVSVAVDDFNGDGELDVAVANGTSGGTVAFLEGDGDGTFRSVGNYGMNVPPAFIAVRDFNSDGKPDLIATHGGVDLSPPPKVSVLLNICPYAGITLAVEWINDALKLSWPLPYTNFVLESTANAASATWETASESVSTNLGRCEVVVPIGSEQRYFRLRKL